MFIKNLKAPCQGCVPPKRSAIPNCHNTCKEYIEFCESLKNNKNIKQDIKKKESDYYGVRHATINKTYKGEHKYNY